MKRTIVFLLIVSMLAVLCGCGKAMPGQEEPKQESMPTRETAPNQAPAAIEGPGFDTPEDAILAYAGALQKGDVQEILSTFAVETYVDNFDLSAYLENTGAYTVAVQQPIPSSDAYTRELNLIARQYHITRNLTYMYMGLGKVENYVAPIPFNGDPYEEPAQLVAALVNDNWMDTLAKLETGRVLRLEDLFDKSGQMNASLEGQRKSLNCEELVPLALEVTIDSQRYYLCVDAACYNGRWYNCNFFGTIGAYLGADALHGGLYLLED